MRQRRRPGLAALFDVAGADGPPRPYHLGFLIGPRINAGGRIGDAALGVRLLTTATTSRRAPSPPNSTGSTAPASRSRSRRWRRPRPRRCRRSGSRSAARRSWWWRAKLAAGRRRPGRGAAEGAVRPAGLRPVAGAGAPPAPAARSPASISGRPCAPRSRPALRSRAADMRWRRA